MEQLSLLFNEAEVYADHTVKEDGSSVAVAAHKRHKKHVYTWTSCLKTYRWR